MIGTICDIGLHEVYYLLFIFGLGPHLSSDARGSIPSGLCARQWPSPLDYLLILKILSFLFQFC